LRWVEEEQDDSKPEREKGQDYTRKASLRGVGSNLTLQAEPFPYHMGGFVEHLGEVSSALLLDGDRGCDNLEIL